MRWMLPMLIGCGNTEDGSTPAPEPANTTTTATTAGGSFVVAYTTGPSPIPATDYFSVTLSAFDADGKTIVTDGTMKIDAEMTAHGHGMNVTPEVTDNGDGTFTASPFLFHMSGHWTMRFALTQNGITEEGHFDVDCCE